MRVFRARKNEVIEEKIWVFMTTLVVKVKMNTNVIDKQ